MKRMITVSLLLACLSLTGCFQAHSEDDLRGVPVTNNPNLIPKSAQTAQAPMFGN